MKNSRYSIFFICLLFCLNLWSQTTGNKYSFSNISTENGLSNNVVYNIVQDADGYIWIATGNGLNCYNGYTAEKFHSKNNDSTSLSSNIVRSLLVDKQGRLWIGTKNGLDLYSKKSDAFERRITLENSPFVNNEIMSMKIDNDGKIWLNTLNDIGYYNSKTREIKKVYSSDVNPYMAVALNKVWILNKNGELNYFDKEKNTLISVLYDPLLKDKAIYFGEDSQRIWFPHEFSMNLEIPHRILPRLPNNIVPNSLLELDENTLWIGSNQGLFEYNYLSKSLLKIHFSQSTLDQQVRTIYADKNKGVWVGTLGGVYHYDPYRKVFNHIDVVKDKDDIIMGIVSSKNGVYANTLGNGIYYKAHNYDEFQPIELSESFPSEGLFVWDIEEVSESSQHLWLATNEGLISLNPKTSEFYKIPIPQVEKDKNISFSILNTEDSFLWVSSLKGIHKIDKVKAKHLNSYSFIEDIKYSGIQKIVSANDILFIATEGDGLFSFNKSNEQLTKIPLQNKSGHIDTNFNVPIWDLFLDEDNVWLGTNQGLYALSRTEMTIKPMLLDDQVIFSITKDETGILWMGSDNGVKTYNPKNKNVRYYNTEHGLKNLEFNRKSVIQSNNHLWFGGINGVTYFNPDKINFDNPNPPYVHIKNLKVITADTSFNISDLRKQVTLPWEHNTIEIDYVGLNYTNASQNSYRFKMEGYDPDWVNNRQPIKARYVKLPVGSYRFRVLAANNDGLWNTSGDFIDIKVLPPFWRTTSAYVVYVLTLLGLFDLFRRLRRYRLRIKKVEQEKEQIAKKVEETSVILNNKTKVYLNSLKYIKSDGNYLEFVTNDKTIIDRNKLKDILDDLPPNFVRVHRSYVVNKNFIKALNSKTLFIKQDIEIPLSRTFKSNLA